MTGTESRAAGRPDGEPGRRCCPVVELRQYTLHPGKRDVLIELFERHFIESQESLGIRLIGQFRDLDSPDRFVWLRGFRDMDTRAAALESFYGGPAWKAHREEANATMVDSDNVLLLHPAVPGSGFALDGLTRPALGAAATADGNLVASIWHFGAPVTTACVDFFQNTVAPAVTEAGGAVLAYFATEHSPNTFPRLPVREGENVFVWFAKVAGAAAQRGHAAPFERSTSWQRTIGPELARRLARPAELLRLAPTARSLLRA
ncbi:MAG TPA: NIPSNAP family protein [Steroidobacteraceae bacterium]|nr:NIPSNAP family protein [Steroidobacteraceae bacterium]